MGFNPCSLLLPLHIDLERFSNRLDEVLFVFESDRRLSPIDSDGVTLDVNPTKHCFVDLGPMKIL